MDDPALGSGCTGKVVGKVEPAWLFVAAGFFHDPSKYMLTARSMLLEAADRMR